MSERQFLLLNSVTIQYKIGTLRFGRKVDIPWKEPTKRLNKEIFQFFSLKAKVQLKYSWLGINMTCDVCTITRDMDIAYRESILPPSCIYKQSQHHVIIVLGAALASLGKYSLQSQPETPQHPTKTNPEIHLLNPNLYPC